MIVCMIDVFNGPLHDELIDIWERESKRQGFQLELFPNKGQPVLRHAEMFNKIWCWARRNVRDETLVMTEHDLIPDEDFKWTVDDLLGYSRAVGVQYVTRTHDYPHRLRRHSCAGGWFYATRNLGRPLDFEGQDPGNELMRQDEMMVLGGQEDGHYHMHYPGIGTHLFWSRHIHENRTVEGFEIPQIRESWKERINEKFAQLNAPTRV